MRKRLIGKAFAVAMTGAMAFTATPVTANIFNVAHVVKAAEADQAEEWTYCYVGLTWAEYWAHEDVYNAGNASSSDVLDSKKESDKGGYDVITRATAKHGLHRGSYQCMATIFTTDADGKTGPEYKVSHWSDDGKTIYLTDGSSVSWNKGKITDNGNTYTMSHYEVSGIKYVPVAVKTSQLNDLKDKYQVVENGGTLTGGYTEVNLSAYTATANVTANTNGLKTATENSDGSFSFSARKTGSESGLKDTAIKKVDSDKITVTVQPGAGSYGEFLRVDLNGDAYGDLGSNMQAVTWTYYGYDDTYSKPLATYGTKFAADNWMHKSMGIQLGLTESIRCQLPEDYDGTGYWKLTISALGYEDFSFNIQATGDNIANAKDATDTEKSDLQKLIDVTRESFFEGIKFAKEGNHLYDISRAIGDYAESFGYGVVRELCGHGIGTSLHESPEIPNFQMRRRGPKLKAGMTLAIEPMVNLGTERIRWMSDNWTVVTADRKESAHYENTILITKDEPKILSIADGNI